MNTVVRKRGGTRFRAGRALLLVSLLLGVVAMHALGTTHESGHEAAMPAVSVERVESVAGHADSDHAAVESVAMCLAVGGMVLVPLGVAAVVFLPWAGALVWPPLWLWRSATRTAPRFPPSLARLQVLRV